MEIVGCVARSNGWRWRVVHEASLSAWDLAPFESCLVIEARECDQAIWDRVRRLRHMRISCPIIVVAENCWSHHSVDLVHVGFTYVLTKPVTDRQWEMLLTAIREPTAAHWKRYAEYKQLLDYWQKLTVRERQTVQYLVAGLTSKQIALRLGITPRAVEQRRARVIRKWGVETASDLCRLALRFQFLEELLGIANTSAQSNVPTPI